MSSDVRSGLVGVGYRGLAKPVLFRLGGGDAEVAHQRTVAMVRSLAGPGRLAAGARALSGKALQVDDPVELFGLRFGNRVGLAAGMDKNATAVLGWPALGFGHVEVGTVTAHPQPGNPQPRLFRLPRSRAVVNRMGFNNDGVAAVADRLREARSTGRVNIPVGVSIGKSKVTPVAEAVADYLTSVRTLHGLADYLAVNVSSPNTPNLRDLQDAGPLRELIEAIVGCCAELAGDGSPTPVLVKLAPDLSDSALDQAVEVAVEAGASGLIATNTTIGREGVAGSERSLAEQAGGLSGAPLTQRARSVVARVRGLTTLPIIGVGGLMSVDDVRAMRAAGADLVQLYTGMIYSGPGLVRSAARG